MWAGPWQRSGSFETCSSGFQEEFLLQGGTFCFVGRTLTCPLGSAVFGLHSCLGSLDAGQRAHTCTHNTFLPAAGPWWPEKDRGSAVPRTAKHNSVPAISPSEPNNRHSSHSSRPLPLSHHSGTGEMSSLMYVTGGEPVVSSVHLASPAAGVGCECGSHLAETRKVHVARDPLAALHWRGRLCCVEANCCCCFECPCASTEEFLQSVLCACGLLHFICLPSPGFY